jgi:hypothetical protein
VERIGRYALLAVGTMILPVLCEAQTVPGFREVGRSAHVRFFTRTDSKAGGRLRADIKRTEAYLTHLESELGQPVAETIDYYRYERPEDIAAQTGVYATGLTHLGDTVVHSTFDYHPHELVHAVAGRMGDPGRFFHEGLAVALGDEGLWGGRDVHDIARRAPALDWRGLSEAFDRRGPDVAYPLAGSFVKHLIETEGLPRLVEFFRACPSGSRRTEAAFKATYGRSLASAVVAWQDRLGVDRKGFPEAGNASRIAQATDGAAEPRIALADLSLASEAAPGTGPAQVR